MTTLRALGAAAILTLASAPRARADACRVLDVDVTPAPKLQIVAWLERPDGSFVDTVYITRLTGTYGIGNRPGRMDLRSSLLFPYGRREFVFPVWAHRHGKHFPKLVFQNRDDGNVSHPLDESSTELFFCRPLTQAEIQADIQTCASPVVYTDKGKLSTEDSLYPPRSDVAVHLGVDDPSVAMFASLNPFDAISQATPAGGAATTLGWMLPRGLADGDYVVFVEVSQEYDFNDTYNPTTYPPPTGGFDSYGTASRGQPSVVYRVPITVGELESIGTTSAYVGYGDPDGADGALRPPDATIDGGTPGHGAARLQLTDDGAGGTYRLRITSHPELDDVAPGAVGNPEVGPVDQRSARIDFTEPGDDGLIGTVAGYELRYRVGTPIDAANFADSMPMAVTIAPIGPGARLQVPLTGLLPETTYSVGVRAYDECRNAGPVAAFEVTTAQRPRGYVDACFVATAAYGSPLANDVELLRRFRDQYLETNVLGELAVETYYSVGPAVAGVVDQSEALRGASREALAPLVGLIRGLHGK